MDAAEPPPAPPVPVTIVTGFLGAGKSTLLNYILTERHGLRIAVIENEFADDIGIESLILKNGLGGKGSEDFFELSNGCLCCTMRSTAASYGPGSCGVGARIKRH